MTPSEQVQALKRAVDSALADALERLESPPQLKQAMSYSLLSAGKRIRPLLVLAWSEACGGSVQAAMPAALAVEMVHAFSLVHDDLPGLDNDDLRRGRPTCHKAFGEGLAILAGDGLLCGAIEVLAEVEPASLSHALVQTLVRATGTQGMVGGQTADITAEGKPGDAAKLEFIHTHKTADLIVAACRMGALAAGAGRPLLDAAQRYGYALGRLYQIVDDLLDLEGEEAAEGKRLKKDAQAGKLTAPSVLGRDPAQRLARQYVEEALAAVAEIPRKECLLELVQLVARRLE